ncbi:MAG: hypothetical protein JWO53_395 [Chlamydiia bacterium]|nr:hypothetical protein [Chlamydiia bacterium]
MRNFRGIVAGLFLAMLCMSSSAFAEEQASLQDDVLVNLVEKGRRHHYNSSSSSSSSSSHGRRGPKGSRGHRGRTGSTGATGATGATGSTGSSGGVLAFADFYALMPGDNAATVAVGAPVLFPQNGSSSGTIVRTSSSTFLLPAIGTYLVQFQVSVTEAGQLMVSLNSGSGFSEVASTVVGRATGTSQIIGFSYVTTTAANSVLRIVNPSGNSTALTITPLAGGTHAVSAHVVITQIS